MFVLRHYYSSNELPFSLVLTSRLEKFCIRHADAVTAPSRDMAHRMARECGISISRISVVPNPIQTQHFERGSQNVSKHKADAQFLVMHVGRLERAKGIEVLARAIPAVTARIPHAHFVFIGGATDLALWKRRLQSVAATNRGAKNIQLVGAVDNTALAAWYRRADLAVVASQLYESFSYTCAQAMAAGLAVVASRIGGIPETLDHGSCGMLVEPGDSEALANAIICLAENPDLRCQMGSAGQRKAQSAFAPNRVAQEILRVYASLGRSKLALTARPPLVTINGEKGPIAGDLQQSDDLTKNTKGMASVDRY